MRAGDRNANRTANPTAPAIALPTVNRTPDGVADETGAGSPLPRQLPPLMPRRRAFFSVWVGRIALRLFGFRFQGNLPNVPRVVIAVAPHTSNWDFVIGVAAMWALDMRLVWFGKHTIFRWPFGALLRTMGGVPVDRAASHGIVGEVVAAFNASEQMWFALAPEGTRSKVERFRSGFLHIAQGAGVPVLLAYLDYEHKCVGFGPLIDPSGDVAEDLLYVENFYRGVRGKRRK